VSLRAWLARRDLLSVDAELHEAEWGAAIAVRELLRQVIRGHAGAKTGSGVAERLSEAFGDGRLRMAFVDGDSMRLEPVEDGWPGTLTRLRLILFEEMAAGRWQRLGRARSRRLCRWAPATEARCRRTCR
jgi:hypothetical protein